MLELSRFHHFSEQHCRLILHRLDMVRLFFLLLLARAHDGIVPIEMTLEALDVTLVTLPCTILSSFSMIALATATTTAATTPSMATAIL